MFSSSTSLQHVLAMSESYVPSKCVRNRTNYEIGKCEEGTLSTIGTKSVQSTVLLRTDVTSGCTTTQFTTVSDVNVPSSEDRLSAGKGKGGKAKKPKKPKKPKPKKTKKTKGKGKKGTKSKSKEGKKGKSKGKTKKKKGKGKKSKNKKQKKGKKSKNKKDKKKKQKEKKKKDQKSGESGGDEEGGGESTEQTTKGKEIKGKKEKSREKTSSSSSSTSTSSSSVSWKQKVKMAAHQQAEKIRALGDEKVEEMKRRREAENERVRELLERHRPQESIGPDPIPFCSGRFDAIFLLPSKMTTVPTMGTDPDGSEKSESIEDSLDD